MLELKEKVCLEINEKLKEYKKLIIIDEVDFERLLNEKSTDGVLVLGESEFAQAVFDLYKTYEFTDKINLFFEREQYGGIINLLKTGILSDEEAVEAILR